MRYDRNAYLKAVLSILLLFALFNVSAMAQSVNGVQVTRIINGSGTFEYMPGDTFTVELDYQVTGVQYLATISETLDPGLAIVNSSNAYVFDSASNTYRWNVTSPVSGISSGKILYEVQVSSGANFGDHYQITGNAAWFSTRDHVRTAISDGNSDTGAVTITVSPTESNGPCIWISNPVEEMGDGDGHIEP